LIKDLFTFSTQEAETLGLECAIVLSAAKKIAIAPASATKIADELESTLRFLNPEQILFNVNRLIDLKLITLTQEKSNENSAQKHNIYRLKLPGINTQSGKRKLDSAWKPSVQAFEVLNMGGVNKKFIDSKIDEFKMYWLEKNQLRDNWNVLFVDFIRREWVKENSDNKGLPVCINSQWIPSSDAFDILELANVSKKDALKHLKEFILYWKENGTALRSWNSKFVDFVKRKEFIGSYEEKNDKKTNRHNEPGEFTKKFDERTKDGSWAENLEL
jgi:hypothetical protein